MIFPFHSSIGHEKPKKCRLKTFPPNRASKYDGINGKDRTQAYTQFIGVYTF